MPEKCLRRHDQRPALISRRTLGVTAGQTDLHPREVRWQAQRAAHRTSSRSLSAHGGSMTKFRGPEANGCPIDQSFQDEMAPTRQAHTAQRTAQIKPRLFTLSMSSVPQCFPSCRHLLNSIRRLGCRRFRCASSLFNSTSSFRSNRFRTVLGLTEVFPSHNPGRESELRFNFPPSIYLGTFRQAPEALPMALPSILRIRRRTPAEKAVERTPTPSSRPPSKAQPSSASPTDADTLTDLPSPTLSKNDLKRATRVRRNFAISASVAYLLSFIFLVLVC